MLSFSSRLITGPVAALFLSLGAHAMGTQGQAQLASKGCAEQAQQCGPCVTAPECPCVDKCTVKAERVNHWITYKITGPTTMTKCTKITREAQLKQCFTDGSCFKDAMPVEKRCADVSQTSQSQTAQQNCYSCGETDVQARLVAQNVSASGVKVGNAVQEEVIYDKLTFTGGDAVVKQGVCGEISTEQFFADLTSNGVTNFTAADAEAAFASLIRDGKFKVHVKGSGSDSKSPRRITKK